jgi:hypothetical protein
MAGLDASLGALGATGTPSGFGAHGGLETALAANTPGSQISHVVVALPSYSVGESLLAHYGDRLLALEHRYLLSLLLTHRLPAVEVVFVGSVAPAAEVVDYYRSLGPDPDGFAARTHVVALDDTSARCVADKLLDRPELVDQLRRLIGGRPALLEPWHVTEHEMTLADRLGVPVNGMSPHLRTLGFKSTGRRLFQEVGVPVPRGVEDVRSIDDVLEAVTTLQQLPHGPAAVVVKHDDSGAGDGNTIVAIKGEEGEPLDAAEVRATLEGLPDWYLADLRLGGVVEELLVGDAVTSPSAQVDLLPGGHARVIATHEQLLGGPHGQVFLGCRFPADAAYASELARYAEAIGVRLAQAGVLGRIAVDFVAVRDQAGRWSVHAVEVNLRKGGTSHPYTALRNLVPGRYDEARGAWVAYLDDRDRTYVCTDNLVDPTWLGLASGAVIEAVRAAGLAFDYRTGTGVVLHMLAGLAVDGRFGVVAIGYDPAHADELFGRTRDVVHALAAQLPG